MKILAIDTSCDETSVAVTGGLNILSNVIWSQASLHAKFGGVYPSLAKRAHEERIGWVINKAMTNAKCQMKNINAIAVTIGPGLAIALEVGIKKAKELSAKYNIPLITVNHLEGHLLSPFAQPKNSKKQNIQNSKKIINSTLSKVTFPSFGLVVSGGNTQLILVKEIGKYKILAETQDDALGEALDKGARMLGLGYPGGAILEHMAEKGGAKVYQLPIPMSGKEKEHYFSYSGLKTAMYRLIQEQTAKNPIRKPSASNGAGELTKQQIYDLAASYQNVAFEHITRVTSSIISHYPSTISYLLVGGGVAANSELRKRIRKMCRKFNIIPLFPYSKKLCTDNAAMIGVAAYFKTQRKEFSEVITKLERIPRYKI